MIMKPFSFIIKLNQNTDLMINKKQRQFTFIFISLKYWRTYGSFNR